MQVLAPLAQDDATAADTSWAGGWDHVNCCLYHARNWYSAHDHVLRALGGRWRAFVKTLVTPPPSRWYSRVPRGSRSPQHPRGAAEFAIISTQNCLISTPPRFVIPGTLMHRMDDVFYLFLQKQKIALSHIPVGYFVGMACAQAVALHGATTTACRHVAANMVYDEYNNDERHVDGIAKIG